MRILGALLALALAACMNPFADTGPDPFTLPVGTTKWDASAPAWLHGGTLHVGRTSVHLGHSVDSFVVGATGAYWMRRGWLYFTSAEGETQRVAEVGWDNMAISADHNVFATVDQSRGPKDGFGTRVIQVVVFDTRTGKQLYRTPDESPGGDEDLADLYPEVMPMLEGVSPESVFFDDSVIRLADGSEAPAPADSTDEQLWRFPAYRNTLFPDGYRVDIKGTGRHRALAESAEGGVGRLSPDRSTIFDITNWPTPAVVYDVKRGQRALTMRWSHFVLGGWSDRDTFFGIVQKISSNPDRMDGPLLASQVVSCELDSLVCTPASPVIKGFGLQLPADIGPPVA